VLDEDERERQRLLAPPAADVVPERWVDLDAEHVEAAATTPPRRLEGGAWLTDRPVACDALAAGGPVADGDAYAAGDAYAPVGDAYAPVWRRLRRRLSAVPDRP